MVTEAPTKTLSDYSEEEKERAVRAILQSREQKRRYKANHKNETASYQKQYRRNNKSTIATKHKQYDKTHETARTKYNQQYYQNNRVKIREQQRQNYQDTKDIRAEYDRQYRKANVDKVREQYRRYRSEHKLEYQEYMRLYNKAHPEKHVEYNRRRRAWLAGSDGNFTEEEFKLLCKAFDNKCVYCHQELPLTPDHIVPLSKGGGNSIENITPACLSCNCRKKDRTYDEYKERIDTERNTNP